MVKSITVRNIYLTSPIKSLTLEKSLSGNKFMTIILGTEDSNSSRALTIKQFADFHGYLPHSLILTIVFRPGKFNSWGLIFEDKIKVYLPVSSSLSKIFSDWVKSNALLIPIGILFDNEAIGSYTLTDLSDTHFTKGYSEIKDIGWRFEVEPYNHSDNTGVNIDVKRKNATLKKSPT
jgi:hypothetical protein